MSDQFGNDKDLVWAVRDVVDAKAGEIANLKAELAETKKALLAMQKERDGLKILADELADKLEFCRKGLEREYSNIRFFVDTNVPGWVRGDDAPCYMLLQIAALTKDVLAKYAAAKQEGQ